MSLGISVVLVQLQNTLPTDCIGSHSIMGHTLSGSPPLKQNSCGGGVSNAPSPIRTCHELCSASRPALPTRHAKHVHSWIVMVSFCSTSALLWRWWLGMGFEKSACANMWACRISTFQDPYQATFSTAKRMLSPS